MRKVQTGPLVGLLAQVALLAALARTVGLSTPAWVVGVSCGALTCAVLTVRAVRHGIDGLGPADRVTFVRSLLVGGVAALVADSFSSTTTEAAVVSLTVVALVLDGVDGAVARRTGTVSEFGARFDEEVDAFLLLVLCVYVAPSAGAWVLVIGAARYAFVAAGWVLPWLRGSLPRRYWGKFVAATQGVTLTIAAAAVLPGRWAQLLLAVSLALLVQSFGHSVWWLWRHRPEQAAVVPMPVPGRRPAGSVSHLDSRRSAAG